MSLKGASLEVDADDLEAAYGPGTTASDVLLGSARAPRQAQLLLGDLAALEARARAAQAAAAAAVTAGAML